MTPELVKGKGFQGWYSPKTNARVPTWCADYSGSAQPDGYFAWLLLPFDGARVPKASVKIISIDGEKVKMEVKTGDSKSEVVEFKTSV